MKIAETGGVIGVEYACMFAILGVRVTIIEKRAKLLEFADQEIVEALSYHLRDQGVIVRHNETYVKATGEATAPSTESSDTASEA